MEYYLPDLNSVLNQIWQIKIMIKDMIWRALY